MQRKVRRIVKGKKERAKNGQLEIGREQREGGIGGKGKYGGV